MRKRAHGPHKLLISKFLIQISTQNLHTQQIRSIKFRHRQIGTLKKIQYDRLHVGKTAWAV